MTTLSLADFRTLHTPGRRPSALSAFAADLVQLLDDGYSFRQLLAYLAGNGVHTCLSNLHGFIARWRRRHAPSQGKARTVESPADVVAPGRGPAQAPRVERVLSRAPAPTGAREPSPRIGNEATPVKASLPPAPEGGELRPAGTVREIVREARAKQHNLYEYAERARKAFAQREADKLSGDGAQTDPTPRA